MKLAALLAVPAGVVTAIGPEVAPGGTCALTIVFPNGVNCAGVPLKVTPVTPLKPVPEM